MKIYPFLLAALVAGAIGAAAWFSGEREARHVFIISFDQGTPRIMQKAEMPVFHRMWTEGAHTWSAFTIVPSITLPSHTSMLTGVGIQKHQILWNDWAPDKGFVQVPTIFQLAKERGLKTAMFVGKEKFKHLEVPGSLDVFSLQPGDKEVAEAFAAEVGRLKPDLCFLHFAQPDTVGHQHGLGSPEQMATLTASDQALQVVRDAIEKAGLADSSVIIMSADHGAHNIPAPLAPGEVASDPPRVVATHGLPTSEDVEIPWVAWGKGVKKDYTITASVVTYDTAATALWVLGIPIPEWFWGRPVTSAFE